MANILVIDSNIQTSYILKRTLEKQSHTISISANLKDATTEMHLAGFDLVIIDIKDPDYIDNYFIQQIKDLILVSNVLILSPLKDVKIGIGLMKLGIKDYLLKPINSDVLTTTINNLLDYKISDIQKVVKSNPKTERKYDTTFIVGKSKAFQTVLHQIQKVSPTNYTVIIYGESGSGKEVIAQEIHKQSKRTNMPFVAIDCGALSKELAGSDLFGHEKGAFTGAHNQKIGSFELSNGGTLFLDEVANLPYEVQVSLLRVVQERKFRRLGGSKDIEFDVRIIVATNETLWTNSTKQTNRFREDLFHRFNEFTITVPPLRERKEDISFLASHFLASANHDLSKSIIGFTTDVHQLFNTYFWHGNIRELSNVIRRSALLAESNYIDLSSMPDEIKNCELPPTSLKEIILDPESENSPQPIKKAATDAEYRLIVKVLTDVKFNKARAARILNIDRKTLYNKLEGFTLNKINS